MISKKTNKRTNKRTKNEKKESGFALLRIVMLLAIVAIVASTLTVMIYINTSVVEVINTPYYFRVQERMIGLNADTDRFAFGSSPPGGEGHRKFKLETDEDVFVMIEAFGDGSEYIGVNKNAFNMAAGTEVTIDIGVYPPLDAEQRTYNGTIRTIFLKPGRLAPKMDPIPVS